MQARRKTCQIPLFPCVFMLRVPVFIRILSLLTFSSFAISAYSQISSSPPLEHIVVEGVGRSLDQTTADIDLTKFSGYTSQLNREDFEFRFVELQDALNTLPAAQVNVAGGIGGYSSISLRGSTGRQVNIFLDGLLLNDAGTGAVSLSSIPSAVIESATVFSNFAPVELGNANLGGAVAFKSRNLAGEEPGAEMSFATGSFGLNNIDLTSWASVDDWQFLGSASYLSADNDFPVEDDAFRSPYSHRLNDQFRRKAAFLKLGRAFETATFHTVAQYSKSDKGIATPLNLLRDTAFTEDEVARIQSVIDYEINDWRIAHRFSYHTMSSLFSDVDSTVGLNRNFSEADTDNLGGFTVIKKELGGHELSASLDLSYADVDRRDRLHEPNSVTSTRSAAVIALRDTWQLTQNWQISAIARQYDIDDEVDFRSRDEDPSQAISDSSFQLGVLWQATEELLFNVNAGRLIRIPTLAEKFGQLGVYQGNIALAQETADVVDASLALELSRLNLRVSAYNRDLEDGIYIIYDSRGVGRPENFGQSRISGVDFNGDYKITDWLQFEVSASLIDSENESIIKAFRGKKMPGIFHQTYRAGAVLTLNHDELRFNYLVQDDFYFSAANVDKAETNESLDFSWKRDWQHFITDISANNLLDVKATSVYRLPTPGRSYVVTFSIEL